MLFTEEKGDERKKKIIGVLARLDGFVVGLQLLSPAVQVSDQA